MFGKENFGESKTFVGLTDKYSTGQVTMVGGSKLFHGAPLLALRSASRLVSMVYFSSFEEDKGVAEKLKAGLASFVWVEREDVNEYIAKSEAVLIGPGMMRSHSKEHKFMCDATGEETRKTSVDLFKKFPDKKWIVDGGTLQVVRAEDIPQGSVVTPNKKEFEMLFGEKPIDEIDGRCEQVFNIAKRQKLVILTKDAVSIASDGESVYKIEGGSEGLIKGGVGDVIAGLTLGFLAKNNGLFAVCAASYLIKKAAEKLTAERGMMFNADDLAERLPLVFGDIENGL